MNSTTVFVEISPLISYAGEVSVSREMNRDLFDFFLEFGICQRTSAQVTISARDEAIFLIILLFDEVIHFYSLSTKNTFFS